MIERSVIITAGGVGTRMGSTIPKQFLLLLGQPVLMHTINRFYEFDPAIQVILVLPENQIDYWKSLCKAHDFTRDIELVSGGVERFHSVQNGLKLVKGAVIGVHDAVRPLVALSVIQNCFEQAQIHNAAIPVMPVIESLRQLEKEKSKSVNRADFRLVQTPQCFTRDVLINAYNTEFHTEFTDDASVVEACGTSIQLVEGNLENIKITTPLDMKLAHIFLSNE